MNIQKKKRKSLAKNVAKTLDIPEDILFGVPRIIMNSNTELRIENYTSIIEYESEKIAVLTKEFIIELQGHDLNISLISDDEVSVFGTVLSVNFS